MADISDKNGTADFPNWPPKESSEDPFTGPEGVRPAPPDEQASVEAMAQRLAPLRGIVGGKSASPLMKQPRPTFRMVKENLEALTKRTADTAAKVEGLRHALTGHSGTAKVDESAAISPPGAEDSIFDQLAWEALQIARLVADIEDAVSACHEAVK